MTKLSSFSRRRLLLLAGTVLAGNSGLAGLAGAAPPAFVTDRLPDISKSNRPPKVFSLPDYNNNPFLRPIGNPYSEAEQHRKIPPTVSGRGVDG
jgi:hypothetical protein